MFKVTPMGYFGMPAKISRGPWFREVWVEDDGLEKYYVFSDAEGGKILLSNNMSVEDRHKLDYFYKGYERQQGLAKFAGLWLGVETVLRTAYFKRMAVGWRFASVFLVGYAYKKAFNFYNSYTYGPTLSAFMKKYSHQAKDEIFDIRDPKREWYNIDDSEYTNYGFEDLHDYHSHHGPQPVSFSIIYFLGW
jgi:hypothetical protein